MPMQRVSLRPCDDDAPGETRFPGRGVRSDCPLPGHRHAECRRYLTVRGQEPCNLASWRSGEICTTFQARPSRRIARITSPEGSSSHARRPCEAERGNAWWLWCQASPSDGSASQRTLVEWSSIGKRRRPKKWQTELIDQVTWCRKNARTRPPQTRPRSAPSAVKP